MVEFGEWLFDANNSSLKKEGESRTLDPKEVSVLTCLLEASPELVKTETLLEAGWPGVIVGDNALHQVISRLRRALEDDARNPRYIETISKRGYRLKAIVNGDVAARAADAPLAHETLRSRSSRLWPAGVAAICLVSLLGASLWWPAKLNFESDYAATPDWRERVAVLPVRDLSDGTSYGWLAKGLTTQLIQQIGLWERFDIVPGAISQNWTTTDAKTGADLYIDGSLEVVGKTVVVRLEAVDSNTGTPLWLRDFRGGIDDPLSLQDDLAIGVSRYFGETAGGVTGPVRPEAYAYFLRYLEFRFFGDLDQERFWLEKTLAIDPSWATGWAELTVCLMRIASIRRAPGVEAAIEQSLRKAELNSTSPAQWIWARHYYEAYWQGNTRKAVKTLRELSDEGAPQFAAFLTTRLMISAGMWAEAEQLLRQNLEQNPFSVFEWELLGVALVNQGKTSAAVEVADRISTLQKPNEFVGMFGPGLAYPRNQETDKSAELMKRYQTALQREDLGKTSTQFVDSFSRILSFEIAIESGDIPTAEQNAEWMLEKDLFLLAGPMLLRLEDPRAEDTLMRVTAGRFRGFAWPYARSNLDMELQNHPSVIQADLSLGFTPELRHDICALTRELGTEFDWRCDP